MRRTHCAGVVLYETDKVLLVKHTEAARPPTGSYGFPAGRVEPGKTAAQTAVRELREEAGLVARVDGLKHVETVLSGVPGMDEDFRYDIFLCDLFSGVLRASDKTIPEWVPMPSLSGLYVLAPDVLLIAQRWYRP